MKGDICRYLEYTGTAPARPASPSGLHWRLPTSNEFGTTNSSIYWNESTATNGWKRLGGSSWTASTTNNLANGQYAGIPTGGYFGATANFFPASGYRATDGALSLTGNVGFYWSGSVYDATYGYTLNFNGNDARPYYRSGRQFGVAVRCVLQE
jgi:uncharacterized protein (TIGR02145 family)